MGDYTATRAHVYTTGAVIYAANHNTNENEIYNKHNAAINSSTGHKHTGGTGDAPKIDSTGLDLTANYTWTGTHTFNNNVTIGTDKKLYFRDTENYIYSPAADKLSIVCNTYDAGTIDHSTSGSLKAYWQTSTTTGEIRHYFRNSDNTVSFEQDYNFASGDVYWTLQSNTKTFLIVSDTNSYVKNHYDFAMTQGQYLYFDAATGSGALTADTYIRKSDATTLVTVVEGSTYLTHGNASGSLFTQSSQDFLMPSGKYIRWDGSTSGDTRTRESSANVLDTYVGGTLHQRIDSGGMQLADIDPPAANYMVRKSGAKFYAEFYVNGTSSGGTNDSFNEGSSATVSSYDITLDFDRNFSSASYASVVTPEGSSAGTVATVFTTSKLSGSVTLSPYDFAGANYNNNWGGSITIFGTQS